MLTGTLAASFSSYGEMRVLDLLDNSLSGSLPWQWATMENIEVSSGCDNGLHPHMGCTGLVTLSTTDDVVSAHSATQSERVLLLLLPLLLSTYPYSSISISIDGTTARRAGVCF